MRELGFTLGVALPDSTKSSVLGMEVLALHHLFEIHVHWVGAGINLLSDQLALKKFKVEGEGAQALPLCEGVWVLYLNPRVRLFCFG